MKRTVNYGKLFLTLRKNIIEFSSGLHVLQTACSIIVESKRAVKFSGPSPIELNQLVGKNLKVNYIFTQFISF